MKHQIVVIANIDKRTDIQIAQVDSENKLNFREMAHVLVDAISLLVKLSNEECEMKDYELMKEVVDHINHNFVSTKAFNDAKIFTQNTEEDDI
jgi:hypothetical protein